MFFKWALEGSKVGKRLEESFWISAYGKAAMPSILEDMQKLGVQARCVFDLDVMLSPDILERVCAIVGVRFDQHRGILNALAKSIKVPPAAEALLEIERTITSIDEGADDEASRLAAVRKIKKSAELLGKSWTSRRWELAHFQKVTCTPRSSHLSPLCDLGASSSWKKARLKVCPRGWRPWTGMGSRSARSRPA